MLRIIHLSPSLNSDLHKKDGKKASLRILVFYTTFNHN